MSKTCVLDKPKVGRKVIKLISAGASQAEAAKAVGVHTATVCRWVNREDIREWVNQQAQEYIEGLPNALALSKDIVEISRHQTKKAILRNEDGSVQSVNTKFIDQKILDAALRETENLRKAVGITPSNANSVVIGNLVLGDQTNVLQPNVQQILDRQLEDILDVEPIEIIQPEGE